MKILSILVLLSLTGCASKVIEKPVPNRIQKIISCIETLLEKDVTAESAHKICADIHKRTK